MAFFMPEVREVWAHNLHLELRLLSIARRSKPYIFVDTEFPGFLKSTARDATEEQRYYDVKFNVDSLKLVQLGITLSDGTTSCAWQFNLNGFNREKDKQNEGSVAFLEKCGVSFDKFLNEGVDADMLFAFLPQKLMFGRKDAKWVTFQGIYDLGYLMKMVYRAPLPEKLADFLGTARELFGDVYDIKYMAKRCNARLGELSLVNLSKALGINWNGNAHQAGHDSLLTAKVYWDMKKKFPSFGKLEDEGMIEGVQHHAAEEKMAYYPAISAQAASSTTYFYYYDDAAGRWVVPLPFPVPAF